MCKATMEELREGEFTKREWILLTVLCFLLGMVIGLWTSPRKNTVIGSNNGNNNVGSFECDSDDDDIEE